MSEYGPIPANHVCVYPKSINGVNEIIQHAISFALFRSLVIHRTPHYDLRRAREGLQLGYCLRVPDCNATPLAGMRNGRKSGKCEWDVHLTSTPVMAISMMIRRNHHSISCSSLI